MSDVTCPQGHPLPDDYNHGLDNRQACPVCGSRDRVFHRSAFDSISVSDTLTTGSALLPPQMAGTAHLELLAGSGTLSARAPGPDTQVTTEFGETYRVVISRLLADPPVRFVNVFDGAGNPIGAQLCESADDLGLAIGLLIAEDIRGD